MTYCCVYERVERCSLELQGVRKTRTAFKDEGRVSSLASLRLVVQRRSALLWPEAFGPAANSRILICRYVQELCCMMLCAICYAIAC